MAAADAAVRSMRGVPSDEILLQRTISFQPVARTTTEVAGIGVATAQTRLEWNAYQGASIMRKHEALCLAGDADVARQLATNLRREQLGAKITFWSWAGVLVGLVGAASTYPDDVNVDCTSGFEGDCPSSMKVFAYMASLGFIGGTVVGPPIMINNRNAYRDTAPAGYAGRVFSDYNEALRARVGR